MFTHNLEDSISECVVFEKPYEFSTMVKTSPGWKVKNVERRGCLHCKEGPNSLIRQQYLKIDEDNGDLTQVTINWPRFPSSDVELWTVLENDSGEEKTEKLVEFCEAAIAIIPKKLEVYPAQKFDDLVTVNYECDRCTLEYIVIRGMDKTMVILDKSRFKTSDGNDGKYIQFDLGRLKPTDIGQFYGQFTDGNGNPERVKIITLEGPRHVLTVKRIKVSGTVGSPFDHSVTYSCDSCEVTDLICNGESMFANSKVSHLPSSHSVILNFPNFQDEHACVYIGVYTSNGQTYRKVFAVVDNVNAADESMDAPKIGEQFEYETPISCEGCTVEKVSVNGVPLDLEPTRRFDVSPLACYAATGSSLKIKLTEFTMGYAGVYQAVFMIHGSTVTKTILDIKEGEEESSEPATTEKPAEETEAMAGDATTGAEGEETTAAAEGEETTAAAEGEETTAAAEGEETTAAPAGDETTAAAAAEGEEKPNEGDEGGEEKPKEEDAGGEEAPKPDDEAPPERRKTLRKKSRSKKKVLRNRKVVTTTAHATSPPTTTAQTTEAVIPPVTETVTTPVTLKT
nr:uncharacterized protein LOC128681932 [Plodia interpunctella]